MLAIVCFVKDLVLYSVLVILWQGNHGWLNLASEGGCNKMDTHINANSVISLQIVS